MTQNLEQRILGPGSKVYGQPIFKEVFRDMREFLRGLHTPFEDITDEQLYELLRRSTEEYADFCKYVRGNTKMDYGVIDNTSARSIYDFNRNHVFVDYPLLKEYLKQLPRTLRWGTVPINGTLNIVQTYDSFVKNFHARPPPDPTVRQEDLYPVIRSNLAGPTGRVAPRH